MANSPKRAGQEARQQLGWWRSHRFLIARRISQLLVLVMFLTGPLFGIWILKGNYSASLLFGEIPLTDPLIMVESLVAGHWLEPLALAGGVIIALSYALLASRVFCSWVCPFNMVTDFAAWLRRKLALRQSATLPRSLRYGILLAVLLGSAVSGTLLWEWLNPITILGRGMITGLGAGVWPLDVLLKGLVMGFGAGVWLIVAIFLFDLLVVEHGWCGHLCPVGAMYGIISIKGIARVSAEGRERCNRCMDCFHVCPEQQILREPLFGKQQSPLVLDKDCISCGRCIDVCAEKVFEVKTRFHRSGAK